MLKHFLVTSLSITVLLYASIAEARRVALVIGNANYSHEDKLANPINDAQLLAKVLKEDLQFDEVNLIKDADIIKLNRVIDQFSQKTTDAEVAFVYFSGHGQQNSAKQNYLLATNAKIEQESDLKAYAVSSESLVSATEGAKIRLVVLDACRDRPTANFKTKSVVKGLTRIKDPSINGLLIAYATEEGKVAQDGKAGGNSPYASALASELQKQDKPIMAIFDEVMEKVVSQTNGQQIPTRSGNLTVKAELVPLKKATSDSSVNNVLSQDAEIIYWDSIKNSSNASDYAAYLQDYPRGRFANLAKSRQKQYQETVNKPSSSSTSTQLAQLQVRDQPQQRPAAGQSFKDCVDCPEMVVVPSGNFMMGSDDGDADEKPVHKVTIAYSFAVGKYEVSKGQFATFVSETGYDAGNSCWVWDFNATKWEEKQGYHWRKVGYEQADTHPVSCVSSEDAKAYVKWLSRKTGKSYRLLSESEWEYVARGGKANQKWLSGANSEGLCEYGNTRDRSLNKVNSGYKYADCEDGYVYTSPIGSFAPNGFGLYDVTGNVLEWVEDCWHDSYQKVPSDGSAWTTDCTEDSWRILRGGSWNDSPIVTRLANRGRSTSNIRNYNVGFRVVRSN